MKKSFLIMAAIAASSVLAGCGGGGGSDTPVEVTPGPLDKVPDTASASSAGMASYLEVLAQNPSETASPLDVSSFAPPTPDDTEPEPVS